MCRKSAQLCSLFLLNNFPKLKSGDPTFNPHHTHISINLYGNPKTIFSSNPTKKVIKSTFFRLRVCIPFSMHIPWDTTQQFIPFSNETRHKKSHNQNKPIESDFVSPLSAFTNKILFCSLAMLFL